MKFFLRDKATGTQQQTTIEPQLLHGVWECGDFRVTDPLGVGFEAVTTEDTPDLRITRLAFLNRMTQEERIDIRAAAPAAPALADFMAMLDAASFVDLGDLATIEGVNFLETAGLLGEGRATAILTAPVQASERPLGM